jgi:hypothetical protein
MQEQTERPGLGSGQAPWAGAAGGPGEVPPGVGAEAEHDAAPETEAEAGDEPAWDAVSGAEWETEAEAGDEPAWDDESAWQAGLEADAEAGAAGEAVGETVEWDPGENGHDAGLIPDEPGQRPATGEPRVDEALARLDELAGRPVTEHRAIFEDVHRRLRDVLGELDTREQHPEDQEAAAGAERRARR